MYSTKQMYNSNSTHNQSKKAQMGELWCKPQHPYNICITVMTIRIIVRKLRYSNVPLGSDSQLCSFPDSTPISFSHLHVHFPI